MLRTYFLFILFLIVQITLTAQEDNLPNEHRVYSFLKEMRVKNVLEYYRDDFQVLSRNQILLHLNEIEKKKDYLSNTEIKLLNKFKEELSDDLSQEKSSQFLFPDENFLNSFSNVFSDKKKYLFATKQNKNSAFLEGIGHLYHGQRFSPSKTNNSNLYDIGFRFRGTLFDRLGYNLTVIKGGVSGNSFLAEKLEPRLLSNFKWVENIENIGNYGFNYGYIRYNTKPYDKMNISFQIGRENLELGYGYGEKLIISGNNPTLDFINFNFDYGIFHLYSIHASTVGEFLPKREDRFTKYLALHKIKLAFNKFEFGIGEAIVYSGRGIELAYLSPITFYKFIEMDIQDRDNGNVFLDFKTNAIDNIEIQGTFFLDENILSNLQDFDRYTNKTAYQIGAFWYQPLGIEDLSLICEYTKIRPYVYTHINPKNTYTSFGQNLGHKMGSNADEILLKMNYNFNERLRLYTHFSFIRKGKNVYDSDGNLLRNVGGDVFMSHPDFMPNKTAHFLDGDRWNYTFYSLGFLYEPFNEIIFEVNFNFEKAKQLSTKLEENYSFGKFKMRLAF